MGVGALVEVGVGREDVGEAVDMVDEGVEGVVGVVGDAGSLSLSFAALPGDGPSTLASVSNSPEFFLDFYNEMDIYN